MKIKKQSEIFKKPTNVEDKFSQEITLVPSETKQIFNLPTSPILQFCIYDIKVLKGNFRWQVVNPPPSD